MSFSDGFINPSVLRGRSLRRAAMRARSAAECTDRSVPLGRLWVPKTYATWADAMRSEGGFRPVYVRRLEGRAMGGMIFGLWA